MKKFWEKFWRIVCCIIMLEPSSEHIGIYTNASVNTFTWHKFIHSDNLFYFGLRVYTFITYTQIYTMQSSISVITHCIQDDVRKSEHYNYQPIIHKSQDNYVYPCIWYTSIWSAFIHDHGCFDRLLPAYATGLWCWQSLNNLPDNNCDSKPAHWSTE